MKQILTVGLLVWSTAQAVELGSVALTSRAGEPIAAKIPIVLGEDESMEDLSVAILSSNPPVDDLTFVLSEGTSPQIRLSSQSPVSAQKLAIAVQISNLTASSEYQYELTLPKQNVPKVSTQKPFVYGPVKSGDTLWHVASTFAKHYRITLDQSMTALYEHNKKAFAKGNENQLMAGSYLKLPATIGQTVKPKHAAVRFKPTDVITHPRETTAVAVTDESTTEIPSFPQIADGKQVAMNFSNALSGVPALKLLNPLTDANTALFSSTLNSVLGAEDTAFVKLIDTMQEELRGAREAIDLERKAKQALESQLNDMQVQLRALTELVALRDGRVGENGQGVGITLPSFSTTSTQDHIILIVAAIGIASLLMYAWEYLFTRRAVVVAPVKQPQVVAARVSHERKPDVYEGDPPSDPVQTKLDLARAYIDIGDKASAQDILLEVVQEGNPSQIMSAEILMSQLN